MAFNGGKGIHDTASRTVFFSLFVEEDGVPSEVRFLLFPDVDVSKKRDFVSDLLLGVEREPVMVMERVVRMLVSPSDLISDEGSGWVRITDLVDSITTTGLGIAVARGNVFTAARSRSNAGLDSLSPSSAAVGLDDNKCWLVAGASFPVVKLAASFPIA